MSTVEDVVGKYVDEVAINTPITSVASTAIGIYLLANVEIGTSSWHWLFDQKLAIGWEFLPTFKQMSVSTLCLVIACAWCGPWLTRLTLKSFLHLGKESINGVISHTYASARKIASTVGFKTEDFAVAQKWKKHYSRSLSRTIRLSCFTYSISMISIATLTRSHALLDAIIAGISFALGIYGSWNASIQFIRTYLPERILIDSSLGFPTVNLTEDVDNAIKGSVD